MENVRPISLIKSVLLFASTSLFIVVMVYFGIPVVQLRGHTFLQAYLLCFYLPFVILFLSAIALYRLEGNEWSWKSFAERYRLQRMDRETWWWTAALLAAGILTSVGLSFTGRWLAGISLFAPPDFFPAEINPTKEMTAGIFMGTPLKGQWWIVSAYFAGWFFNIFGEELLWRGYLLPRQELTHGNYAWLVQGVLWALWHIYWRWNLLTILPVALLIPFVVQRTKNTWVGIIAHGLANFIPVVVILVGILF